jgi:kojibiose phosphorylase
MDPTWTLTETAFRPATARAYEGLFTLGSGYLHLRGSLEEHLEDAPQNTAPMRMPDSVTSEKFATIKAKWGTYVPGLFGRHPFLNREMINLPFFLDLAPHVAGERLDVEHGAIEAYRRTLDLRRATLRRTLRWRTRAGAVLEVTFERFVSADRPHLAVQRMTLAADRAVEVVVRVGIDADVRTNGCDHFADVAVEPDLPAGQAGRGPSGRPAGARGIACRLRTDAGDTVTMVSRLAADADGWAWQADPRRGAWTFRLHLAPGGRASVEKRTAVATSRDLAPCDPAALLDDLADTPYAALAARHEAAWAARWDACDVVVEGDERGQRALRTSLYHLLRAHVPGDPRVAIDAKGYAGEGYYGRYFWDTEMYLVPFFLYTDPPRARTLVDFRVHCLPGARANAAAYGYPGAKYAWESDGDGGESCALWPYRDHEVHVTADVVYAMAHYAAAVPDPAYLRGPATEVILETARYWMARIDRRPGDDHPSLLGVMGPDEYTPICHNNAFTNRLVRFALDVAARAPGASAEEARAFAEAARGLPIPRAADGVLVLQCEDFELLAEPQFERFWPDRRRPFSSQVPTERLYRTRCPKQADVLMLMYLVPHEFSDAEVRRAWDYYVPYTTHDSSLSAGVHAIIACRLGLDDAAWDFWLRAAGTDLDVEHGGAAEGVHIAGAGANWQVAVLGFAGMATALQSDRLRLRPRLPKAWDRLAFPILWKGCPVSVDITPAATTVRNRGRAPLPVTVGDETREVAPGAAAEFRTGR